MRPRFGALSLFLVVVAACQGSVDPVSPDALTISRSAPPIEVAAPLIWSGYSWSVSNETVPYNNFCGAPQSVFVDADDRLHLLMRGEGERWLSAEITIARPLGYGTYEWQNSSPLNVVADRQTFEYRFWHSSGKMMRLLFSPGYSPFQPMGTNAVMVVEPFEAPGHQNYFAVERDHRTSHRLEWSDGIAMFTSWKGHDPYPPAPSDVLSQWCFIGADLPPTDTPLTISLFLYQGVPPEDRQPIEVVVDRFTFTPYL